MSNNLLKTGGSSIILGENHYKDYFQEKKGKLLKITKIIKRWITHIFIYPSFNHIYILCHNKYKNSFKILSEKF